jgi:hypothetical protein
MIMLATTVALLVIGLVGLVACCLRKKNRNRESQAVKESDRLPSNYSPKEVPRDSHKVQESFRINLSEKVSIDRESDIEDQDYQIREDERLL